MKTIVDYFVQTARQYPDRVAVADCEGEQSYKVLDELSNAIAHHIHSQCVLIILPRRNSFFATALAAMKSGGCYVGCNTDYPADRIRFIAEDSKAGTIVTNSEVWGRMQSELSPVVKDESSLILIDQTDWSTQDTSPINRATWDQDAFMLYTSGTTGRPKGVIHTIGSITRIMQAFAEWDEHRDTPIREAVFGDLCFAASLTDLYTPLFTGGSVHIIDEVTRMDMTRLADFINSQRIDRIFLGSSLGVAMLKQFDLKLNQLILAGEKLTGVTPEMAANIDVINEYGSSEAFPLAMYHVTGYEEIIPVGTQSDGDVVYILDPKHQPVAKGQMGEIYFSSDRIAKGYNNLPELTAERFLADPWRPGYRMLRTCDLGYINDDGNLMHCGRADNMFKINGQRVEPGEVENVAQLFPDMGDCACVKKELPTGDALCLYFEATGTIDIEALRTFMATKLTHYMVPEFIVQLDELPRNARGKIDRKAMPDPLRETTTQMIAPVNDAERTLFDIVSGFLGTTQFGVTDNLFTLGMTSMTAMKTAAEATRRGVLVKATDIIRLKTIRKTLQEQMTMMRWFGDYDPARPTAVFTHGISITSNIQEKLKILSRQYNVFTIEPIHEHYHYIFEGEPMEEVIELYYALMEVYMPADATIAVFAGVSYGGKLAYLMACKHYERTGQQAGVILGDTLLRIGPMFGAIYKAGKLEEYRKAHNMGPIAEAMRERMFTTFEIDFYGEHIPPYDGQVVLLHALKNKSPFDNAALWQEKASRLHIIPVDFTHDEICVDNPQTLPYWEEGVELIEQS